MNEKLKYLLLYASIFIWSSVVVKSPVEIYTIYLVIFGFLPIFLIRHGLPRQIIFVFGPLLILGLSSIALGNNTMGQFFKIFIGLFVASIFFHHLIADQKFNVTTIFQRYATFGYWIAVIGCIQFASYQIGLAPGYNFNYFLNKWGVSEGGIFGIRINSLFSEPAYIAATLAPLFLVSLNNLFKKRSDFLNRKRSIIVVACYAASFSSLGISAIFLALILLFSNYGFFRYVAIAAPALFFGYRIAYDNLPEFRDRFESVSYLFSSGDELARDVHGSSFVLYNNYVIATENWKRNPLVGTGLGSHAIAFEKYSLTKKTGALKIEFNKADANSLFLRALSETGLLGIGFLLFLIVKFYVSKRKSCDDVHWVISNGLLLIIFTYLLRQGHYFYNGFPFFVWLYYYVWKSNRATLANDFTEQNADTEVAHAVNEMHQPKMLSQ